MKISFEPENLWLWGIYRKTLLGSKRIGEVFQSPIAVGAIGQQEDGSKNWYAAIVVKGGSWRDTVNIGPCNFHEALSTVTRFVKRIK